MKDNNNSLAVPNLHIPPEAVEAAARAAHAEWQRYCASQDETPIEYFESWDDLLPDEQEQWRQQATAAIRAALPYLVELQNGGRHV